MKTKWKKKKRKFIDTQPRICISVNVIDITSSIYIHFCVFLDISIKIQVVNQAKSGQKANKKSCEMKTKLKKRNLILEINNDDKDTNATGRTTPRLQPPKRDQAQATTYARGNRFGFRQNVVRPVSGITPKFNTDFDTVNNNTTLDNDKRRSKSATAPTQRSSVVFAEPCVTAVSGEQSYTNAR